MLTIQAFGQIGIDRIQSLSKAVSHACDSDRPTGRWLLLYDYDYDYDEISNAPPTT